MLIDRVVDFLNEAFRQDPESVKNVFRIQVDADEEAIMHPHIQVTPDDKVRLIGLLNGLTADMHNRLAMKFNEETGAVIGFCVVTVGQ